jgi:hypothetical protein
MHKIHEIFEVELNRMHDAWLEVAGQDLKQEEELEVFMSLPKEIRYLAYFYDTQKQTKIDKSI